MSDLWLNLEGFSELFFYMPSDVRTCLLTVFGVLLIVACKRIFLG